MAENEKPFIVNLSDLSEDFVANATARLQSRRQKIIEKKRESVAFFGGNREEAFNHEAEFGRQNMRGKFIASRGFTQFEEGEFLGGAEAQEKRVEKIRESRGIDLGDTLESVGEAASLLLGGKKKKKKTALTESFESAVNQQLIKKELGGK